MRFAICIPDYDETVWREVDYPNVSTGEDAAELYAERICSEDCELYSTFEDSGAVVLVRGAGKVVAVRVTAERMWAFRGAVV